MLVRGTGYGSELERELGEPLFHRHSRSVRLTGAGEALLPHARAALAAAERGRESVAALRGLLRGRLRVGVSRPVDHRLAATLGAFHRAHPAIEILLTEQHHEPILAALAGGDLDAAVLGMPAPRPAGIQSRLIGTEPLVLGARPDHPLSSSERISLGRLREEPMITLTRGSGLRAVLEAACRQAGFTPRITAETDELGHLVALAAEG